MGHRPATFLIHLACWKMLPKYYCFPWHQDCSHMAPLSHPLPYIGEITVTKALLFRWVNNPECTVVVRVCMHIQLFSNVIAFCFIKQSPFTPCRQDK